MKTVLKPVADWIHRRSKELITLGLISGAPLNLLGQGFDSGSDGSYGALIITAGITTNLAVPPSGVFHCTSISIGQSATVRFTPNALNTPVYLMATSNVFINGTLDVSGSPGSSLAGGLGGPGGFNGGGPATASLPAGDGQGPGGGRAGGACNNSPGCVGSGSFGTSATPVVVTNHGAVYGSPLLIPLIGGSGGGGTIPQGNSGGGGGGGGAILIASSTQIEFGPNGRILARGLFGAPGHGSGGAIRLVASRVLSSGSTLDVSGGGSGRIRIDALDYQSARFTVSPEGASASYGKVLVVFPEEAARLDITRAAGRDIPEGTNSSVVVLLPTGSNTNQVIRVQARNFVGNVPIEVAVTPQNGPSRTFAAEINVASGNPAFADVNVTIPVNTEAAIHAWTR